MKKVIDYWSETVPTDEELTALANLPDIDTVYIRVSWREPYYNDYIYQIILGGGISLYLAKLKITKIRTEEA